MTDWNKIRFAKLTKEIDYSTFGVEMTGAPKIHVWLNLDGETMNEFRETQTLLHNQAEAHIKILKQISKLDPDKTPERVNELTKKLEALTPAMQECNDRVFAWYAKVWSQHKDKKTHVTADQLREFSGAMQEDQPAFWAWLQNQTQSMILLHGNQHLKN